MFENGYAIIVGVANYENVRGLPEAVSNDAGDIADLLQSSEFCGFPAENVRVLIDNQATLANLTSALSDLAVSTGENDTVVIFFSGHGARFTMDGDETSALVPYDADIDNASGTTLTEKELSSLLGAIRARRLLVLIDACHAGGAGTLKNNASKVRLGFSEKALGRLSEGAGRVIIASCRASETSLVMSGARNSVFTERLLEALRGHARTAGDGLIRVFDIFNYVAEHVAETVPGQQHPIFKASDLEDNFPVVFARGGMKSSTVTMAAADQWSGLEALLADLYPTGPTDQDIWTRAGGDVSRLKLGGTGRATWFAALRMLRLGGGGSGMSRQALIRAALDDYPQHVELSRFV